MAKTIQTKLERFLNPVTTPSSVKSTTRNIPEVVPHRDIIIYILQLGVAVPEKSLLRAIRQEIKTLRAKGREVAPITLQKLQRQLKQLIRERWVEQIGYCYRLRR